MRNCPTQLFFIFGWMDEVVSDVVSGDLLDVMRGFDFVEVRFLYKWDRPVMNCIF